MSSATDVLQLKAPCPEAVTIQFSYSASRLTCTYSTPSSSRTGSKMNFLLGPLQMAATFSTSIGNGLLDFGQTSRFTPFEFDAMLRAELEPSLQRCADSSSSQSFPVLFEARDCWNDSCVFHQLHEINGKMNFKMSHSKGLRPVSVPSLQRYADSSSSQSFPVLFESRRLLE